MFGHVYVRHTASFVWGLDSGIAVRFSQTNYGTAPKDHMFLTTPDLAFQYLRDRLLADVEEFWTVSLNSEKAVLDSQCTFRGSVDVCLFHPRDVFRFALLHNASSVLVAHNHPSGTALPSAGDQLVTRQLVRSGRMLQLPVVDHLIVAGDRYYSFREHGLIR